MPTGVYVRHKSLKPSPLRGKNRSEETINKISSTKRRKIANGETTFKKGADSHAWRGGVKSMFTIERIKTLEQIAGRPKPEICEICGGEGRICFDHNHATGKFRGWICHTCNGTLGFVRDRVEVLQKMIDYLNKPDGNKVDEITLKRLHIKTVKEHNGFV